MWKIGRVRHERDYCEIDGKDVGAWKCYNCGNVKRPRKREHMSWDFITKEATTDAKMNRRNKITFHCFNPNGIYAALKVVQNRVSETVDKTGVPNGALLVYGSFNDYPRKRLFDALEKKSASSYDIHSAIRYVKDEIEKVNEWIAKTLANPMEA